VSEAAEVSARIIMEATDAVHAAYRRLLEEQMAEIVRLRGLVEVLERENELLREAYAEDHDEDTVPAGSAS
jgi:cell shape-determining protein MreC